jgi:ankyrin repeat protein
MAIREGDLEKVKALLKGNSHLVFSKDDLGVTPLHTAAFWGHKDVVELLLANKAEVNATDKHGQTPLHKAARSPPVISAARYIRWR